MALELVPKNEIGEVVNKQVSAQASTDEGQTAYHGPERRGDVRRLVVDRRDMVRFEIKSDRRGGKDRRTVLQMWDGRDL